MKAPVVSDVQMPMARERRGSSIVPVMSARELGTRKAPAAPCTARDTMRNVVSGESATATEATPNPMRPILSTRIRPYASLTAPATRMSAPRVMRYESTAHC